MTENEAFMNKFFTRFKASEHGGEYLMRFISAWLCSLVLILLFRPVREVFNKEYAGEAPYLLLILFFAVFYGLLTVLRFIPKLRDMKTDCAALLISTAQFTVAYAVVMFREKVRILIFSRSCPVYSPRCMVYCRKAQDKASEIHKEMLDSGSCAVRRVHACVHSTCNVTAVL